ncbi:complex I subunit 4 family protein [Stigmatella aurantiaca]|uniref:NADH dehydrogenase I, M subunit n=1 Tax=Stigmatella aurantiaca (strain DW4/3-1) TaxID=378806 RepID=Q092X4_STIAD|nr:NADH-quinone oxidoreductase subunit M [Stigmatella aurantiaca]ADO73658.1 NADH dehydrogenase I, M subunit [Stigmatella aurantiaca DW4/3-1]EAU66801.1 NADH-quinone oxidoreductase chain m [Stigmatella aurantiaca DW4/3-1]
MSNLDPYLLSLVVFLPLLFTGILAFIPAQEHGPIRVLSLLGLLADGAVSLWAWLRFDPAGAEFQLEHRASFLELGGVSYHVGVDGLAISLVMLTALLGPVVVLASWRSVQERVKEFHLALLVLQVFTMGALVSLDLMLFYIFFEASLLPTGLLVGVWGGALRNKASARYFLASFAGSVLMLVSLLAVYSVALPAGQRTFDYALVSNTLQEAHRELAACRTPVAECGALSPLAQSVGNWGTWIFAGFALAFAVKSALFPVHRWLAETQSEAPRAASVLLAIKLGAFGFWRFGFPLFPDASQQFRGLLTVLAVISIVYGALMCLAQRDIRRFLAYATISHLGSILLGMLTLTEEGATGSAYHMINQGLSTAAIFLLVGFLQEQRGSKQVQDYGGLARTMPRFAGAFVLITFSLIGLPGTNGFVSEFLVLLGAFKSNLSPAVGALAATGVILSAAYMLWLVQKVLFGPVRHPENHALRDLHGREWVMTVPFLVLVVVLGLKPQPILDRLEPASRRFVARSSVGMEGANPPAELLRVTSAPLPEQASRDRVPDLAHPVQ